MQSFRDSIMFPLVLLLGGVAVFCLILFVTGQDPDEKPLTLYHWVLGGMLIGPGFGYLVKWRQRRDRSCAAPSGFPGTDRNELVVAGSSFVGACVFTADHLSTCHSKREFKKTAEPSGDVEIKGFEPPSLRDPEA